MLSLPDWQQALWAKVQDSVRQNRWGPTWLLAAPEGFDREGFARFVMAWWLCAHRPATGACGQCRSCTLLAADNHPDAHWVSPEDDDEKSSAWIKVDRVRAVQDQIQQRARQGAGRVVVFSPAEALATASANALLKTLEEPGDELLFLLLCHSPARLIPTVRSRCQVLDLTAIDVPRAQAWVAAALPPGADPATCWSLARGAPVLARDLPEAPGMTRRAGLLADLLAVAQRQLGPQQAANRLTPMSALPDALWAWQSLLQDVARCVQDPSAAPQHRDLAADIQVLAARCAPVGLMQHLAVVQDTQRLMATNVSDQSLWEALWRDWARVTRPIRAEQAVGRTV